MSDVDQRTLSDSEILSTEERLDRARELVGDAIRSASASRTSLLCERASARLANVVPSDDGLDEGDARAVDDARRLLTTLASERRVTRDSKYAVREAAQLLEELGPRDGANGGTLR